MANYKPSRLLELSGAYRKDPGRRRPHEPKPSGPLGEPPSRLPAKVRKFWDELVAAAAPGVLTASDAWTVELCARLMEKAVRNNSPANIIKLIMKAGLSADDARVLINAQQLSGAELSTLRSLLGSLGMSPVDRAKLSVQVEKPKNKFAELAEQASKEAADRPN